MTILVPNWTENDRKALLKQPLFFQHNLLETGAFTEEAIAHMLETHPDAFTVVNINEIYDDGTCKVRTGVRGNLTGAELLEHVKAGRIWISLRHAFMLNGETDSLPQQFFRELEAHNPGFKVRGIYPNLLISGPQARVAYHADTPAVILMHLMGKKRIWLYPNSGKFLEDEAMERVSLRETTEDLPFNPEWDKDAFVADLEPGMAFAWPYNAPHRVDNQGTFNVSLSCEYMTWEGRLRHGVYYTNGTLRRRFGMSPPRQQNIKGLHRIARWVLSLVFKALKINVAAQAVHKAEFEVADAGKVG
jgi:hypothetical protein